MVFGVPVTMFLLDSLCAEGYSFDYIKYVIFFRKKWNLHKWGQGTWYPFPLLFPDNCKLYSQTTYTMEDIGDSADKLVFEIKKWKAVK